MKKSSTYMEKYECFQENYCRNGVKDTKRLESCLEPEMIVQGRYIIGDVQRVNCNNGIIVYTCLDMMFDRVVLIWELFSFKYCVRRTDGAVIPDESEAACFKRNVSAYVDNGKRLIRLYKEPDILTVYSSFEENNTGYIVSEYQNVEESLKFILSKNSAIEPKKAIEYLKLILIALEKIHRQEIKFGRLELENIFIFSEHSIKLFCFYNTDVLRPERSCNVNGGGPITVKMAASLFFRMITGQNFDVNRTVDKKLKPYRSLIMDAISAKGKTQIKSVDEFIGRIYLIEQKTAQSAAKVNRKKRNRIMCFLVVLSGITVAGITYSLSVYRQKVSVTDFVGQMVNTGEMHQTDKDLRPFEMSLSERVATPSEIKPAENESNGSKSTAQPHETTDRKN